MAEQAFVLGPETLIVCCGKFLVIAVPYSWASLSLLLWCINFQGKRALQPREAVGATPVEVFKASLDGALSNLFWWKVSLLVAGGGWN